MDAALKVVVDIVNKDAIKALQKDVENETRAVQDLNKQFIQGTINAQQFGTASIAAGQKIANANTAIKGLQESTGSAGRGLGQLAYAIDDVQYGFNAIVNNIPQIVLAMGGGMGLAGGIGIAAVAVNQLINHWGELTSVLQSAWSGDPIAQLEALRLKAEEAGKEFEKLAKTPTAAQGAQVGGVAGAITEAGTEGMTSALAAIIAQDPAVRKKAASGINFFGDRLGFLHGQITGKGDVNRATGDEARKQAEELIGGTQKPGAAGEKARLDLAQKLRALGHGDLADTVLNASPERQKEIAQKRLELQGGRNDRERVQKMEEDAKKFGKAEADEWRKGVEEAQKHLDAKNKAERVNALEDQRTAILEKHHQEDLTLEAMRERFGQGSQRFQSPKAVSDYYQKAGLDSPIVRLAQETKRIQEDQRTELKQINAHLAKERRLVINR